MQLLLARHGNTFNPSDRVVWVGSQNDLPLVPTGVKQAQALAQALTRDNLIPTAVYCGPLERMTHYAAMVVAELKLKQPPTVDQRLNEIDYGRWSGLTSEEVRQQFGVAAFENWDKLSQWPSTGEWGESAALVAARIKQIAQDLQQRHAADDCVLLVASNGCLRYFLDLLPETQKPMAVKMATGRMSKLTYANGEWQLDYWNVLP